jgi:hypothetical protein
MRHSDSFEDEDDEDEDEEDVWCVNVGEALFAVADSLDSFRRFRSALREGLLDGLLDMNFFFFFLKVD